MSEQKKAPDREPFEYLIEVYSSYKHLLCRGACKACNK